MRYSKNKYCLIDFKAIKIQSIYFIDFATNHNAIFSWNLIRLNNSSSWNQNKNLIHSNHESVIKIPQKERKSRRTTAAATAAEALVSVAAAIYWRWMGKKEWLKSIRSNRTHIEIVEIKLWFCVFYCSIWDFYVRLETIM